MDIEKLFASAIKAELTCIANTVEGSGSESIARQNALSYAASLIISHIDDIDNDGLLMSENCKKISDQITALEAELEININNLEAAESDIEKLKSHIELLESDLSTYREQKPIGEVEIAGDGRRPIFYLLDRSKDLNEYQRFSVYAQAAPAQEGWKLVPIEPTDEMIEAGADASNAFRVDILRSYEAMLSVSPQPTEETP